MAPATAVLVHAQPPNPPVMPSSAVPDTPPIDAAKPIDMQKMRVLGGLLMATFKTYENHRRPAEQRWARNLRQFLGEYDPDVLRTMDKSRSQAYPRLTRIKVVSMLSRLMNLLFPTSEKNWGIAASPVPNLSQEDLQQVLDQVIGAAAGGGQITDEVIEAAIRAFASTRASNLEREIEDQLAEVGGNRNLPYVAICRKVILSAILYGVGVVKGPFVRQQMQRTWMKDPTTGKLTAQEVPTFRPQLQFVSLFDYYPDMTAKHFHEMDGQFERRVLAASQLRELGDRPDFFGSEITGYMAKMPKGNWKEKGFETDLRTMGVQANVNVASNNKYEIVVWNGFVNSADMRAANIDVPGSVNADMVDAEVWVLDGLVIKCVISPWAELEPDERVQMYHQFQFEEDDSNIFGNALPNIMRDSQMNVAAASRMMLDNASVICGPMLEVNTRVLRADVDTQSIQAYKVWARDDDPNNPDQVPAVREIKIEGHIPELKSVVDTFMGFADMETFVSPATGGDMQKGPSEPFRTAAGASMIQGQAALPFKDVVRNYDTFTISVVNAMVLFNKHFNTKTEVQGDFTPIARGASSLIAKEVRGMALDVMANTIQPEQRKYVNWYGLFKEQLAVRDIQFDNVIVDTDGARAAEQAEAQAQADDKQNMDELMKAEIRQLLSGAVKNLTAADSNSASADEKTAKAAAATYNAELAGLESGITAADVHASRTTGKVPEPIARGFRLKSGKDKPPTTGATK